MKKGIRGNLKCSVYECLKAEIIIVHSEPQLLKIKRNNGK